MKKLFNSRYKVLGFLALVACTLFSVMTFGESVEHLADIAYNSVTLDTLKSYIAPASSSLSLAGLPLMVIKTGDKDEDEFKLKTEDEIKGLDDEAKAKYFADLVNAQTKGLQYMQAVYVKAKDENKAEIDKTITELMKTQNATLVQQVKTMGESMTKLQKEVETKTEGQPISMQNAIYKALVESKDKLNTLKDSAQSNVRLDIAFKATQNASDITTGTDFAYMEPGVGQIATRQPFMRDLFRNVNTTSEYIKYNDQQTIVRDAKNVAACAASTHTSKITWQVRTMQIKKVRDFVDVCIDMMEDYDFVTGEIRDLVNTDVRLKVDEQLLLGDNTGANLNSVAAVASTFAAGSYATAIQAPTLFDLLIVAQAQIADFGQNNKFMANVVVLNPVDATKMRLEKDVDNNYLLPNFVSQNGTALGGMRIIENQLVPANQAYIFDSSKGTVYSRKGITVDFGFENNDNFEKELVTVKAYERLNFRVRNVDANAFMHIASISAALTAITKP